MTKLKILEFLIITLKTPNATLFPAKTCTRSSLSQHVNYDLWHLGHSHFNDLVRTMGPHTLRLHSCGSGHVAVFFQLTNQKKNLGPTIVAIFPAWGRLFQVWRLYGRIFSNEMTTPQFSTPLCLDVVAVICVLAVVLGLPLFLFCFFLGGSEKKGRSRMVRIFELFITISSCFYDTVRRRYLSSGPAVRSFVIIIIVDGLAIGAQQSNFELILATKRPTCS